MRVQVASVDELRETRGLRVTAGGREIALFTRAGTIFAVGNICAHQHFPVLHRGSLDGLTVTCPMHGWTYDLRTGIATTGDGAVPSYEVTVEDGMIFIDIPGEG